MATLVIDIGNSYIKTAIFNVDELVWVQSSVTIDEKLIKQTLKEYKPEKAIFSTVKKNNEGWETSISKNIPLIKFDRSMATSIKNHYRTPHTLGLDRLAAVIGANAIYPEQANLVIDAGTCITYDA